MYLSLLAVGFAPFSSAWAQETALQHAPGVEYRVNIRNAPSREAQKLMEASMRTVADQENPPASMALLVRRAQEDLERMHDALASLGYFKARIIPEVLPAENEGGAADVNFIVTQGPRFTLDEPDISVLPGKSEAPVPALPPTEKLGLTAGSGYEAQDILDAQAKLLRNLQNHGYPYAKIQKQRILADFSKDTVHVEMRVAPGPLAHLGRLKVVTKGPSTVAVDYLRALADVEPGDLYDKSRLNDMRQSLLGTGLYSQVDFTIPPAAEGLNEEGRLPLTLTVTEREHRSFRVGASYSTDRGPGGVLAWEHRNLFGAGERLEARLEADQLSKAFSLNYLEPRFLRDDQNLRLTASYLDQDLEAFTGRSLRLAGLLELNLNDTDTLGYGGAYTFLEVNDDPLVDGTVDYYLASLPLYYDRNRRDDLLNPTAGYFLRADAEPFFGTFGEQARFIRYTVGSGTYFKLTKDDTLVLAVRGKLGQIFGAELIDVPASERFYAGGGGSVRGYEYKTLSPLKGDDPTGGRSLVESSAELRWRMPSDFGLVAFVDAGRAYDKPIPDFGEPLAVGVGVGARYYLGFGPIRLDVAIPLNRRKDLDPPVQVYASIGQSF